MPGLLKTSVATNIMVSRPVQTEVVRKFTGSTAIGYVILGHDEYAGQRTPIYGINRALLEVTVRKKCTV